MTGRKKVLAISGSTRKNSSNQQLINAVAKIFEEVLEIIFFDGLAALPHFDPDENDHVEVKNFRQKIDDADGVLICTPEYAHGVPGSLKNAIDWTISTNQFYHKPTVLITASTDGRFGHAALLETLKVIEAKNIEELNLLIQFVRTKIDDEKIIDQKTLEEIKLLMQKFIATINEVRSV